LSGDDDISAKDFRTWAGTVLAAVALSEFDAFDSEAAAKRNVRRAIESVAQRLGNTPTICRKCYVHPEILQCYLDGELVQTLKNRIERELAQRLGELAPAEAATLALLHRRMNGGAKNSRRRRPASRTSQASLTS
jgi:DNA topoisomerase I